MGCLVLLQQFTHALELAFVGRLDGKHVLGESAFRDGPLVGERLESMLAPVASHAALVHATEWQVQVGCLLDDIIEANGSVQ